jgi:putative hydrolase of the HAD superfamily
MDEFWTGIRGVVWDWGDTLMRDIPGQDGPMAAWPHVEAMPGAVEALDRLQTIPVHCLATNAQDSGPADVAVALERVGLRGFLTRILVSPELGVAKPDPDFFREVTRRLDLPPADLVSVGNDYGKDIVPAKAVGMRTILVGETGSPASVSRPGASDSYPDADLVVATLKGL